MSRKLDELLSTYAYDARQKNQLRMADEKGLDLDMIKNPLYDWEQMREIALAMEYGLNPSPLCDPTIPSESMENIRIHLFENQGVFENAKAEVSLKKIKIIVIILTVLIIFCLILSILYIQKTLIVTVIDNQPPVIHLKQSDMTIIQDDDFDALDYVADVSDNFDNLSLKDIYYEINGDVSQVGNFTVLYSTTDSSGNETTETLNVKVEQKSEEQTQSNSNNKQKASDNAKKQNKINNGLPSTKIFYIRDYNYNIEACKNAAVSYMNDQLNKSNATYGELQPYQENDVIVGYNVIFK